MENLPSHIKHDIIKYIIRYYYTMLCNLCHDFPSTAVHLPPFLVCVTFNLLLEQVSASQLYMYMHVGPFSQLQRNAQPSWWSVCGGLYVYSYSETTLHYTNNHYTCTCMLHDVIANTCPVLCYRIQSTHAHTHTHTVRTQVLLAGTPTLQFPDGWSIDVSSCVHYVVYYEY